MLCEVVLCEEVLQESALQDPGPEALLPVQMVLGPVRHGWSKGWASGIGMRPLVILVAQVVMKQRLRYVMQVTYYHSHDIPQAFDAECH